MPSINVYYRKPSALERYAGNAARAVDYAARNTGIQYIRGDLYARDMLRPGEELTADDMLSLDGRISPQIGSAGDTARNVLILDNGEIQMAFFDAKIKVTQSNTIVETALTGRKGTVKEYIQAKDYVIDVKGNIIADKRAAFPLEAVGILRNILETPANFNVANVLLNKAFDVNKVVCKTVDFDMQSQNYMNAVSYTLTLISDEDYELEIE